MSDFYKRFLLEDVPKPVPGTGKQIFLGAFGKHPGWDDHIEDLGLETASLVEAKKLFYVQGIGGEIDAGAWEKLDESQRLAVFKHVFVWQRPGQYLIGRLWASSDGKGRTRYPMVVCAHCAGVSLLWALDQVLPRLERIETACATTQSATEVRAILDRHRTDLRSVVSGQTTELSPPMLDTDFITKFAARPELGPNYEGWLRVLYAVQSQLGAFARGKFNVKSDASTLRPQQIRVPRAADSIPKAMVQWSNFFLSQIDPQAPMLLTVPLEEEWLDVTIGQPASQEMFSLRASPKAMPLASQVPYNLSPEFRERARQLLAALESGRPPASILQEAPAASPATESGPRNKLLKWFGGGAAALAVAAAILAALLPQAGEKPVATTNPEPQAPPSQVVAVARPPPATPPPIQTTTAALSETQPPPDPAALARMAEEKRLAEEKARMEVAARLKAAEVERERTRQAAEAAARQLAEEKRLAQEKTEAAARELALLKLATTTQPPVSAAGLSPANRLHTNTVGMVFVQMPGYWVGKYEVTQAEFEKVTGHNPSVTKAPSRPVDSVNWEDAQEFCRKLTRREEAAGALLKGWAYGLPTDAQWTEFAADADLSAAISSVQRRRTNSEPVGSALANRFGVHDARGNVWEWCLSTNEEKVLRGGAYDTIRGFVSADQWKLPAEQRRPQVGFRCVLTQRP